MAKVRIVRDFRFAYEGHRVVTLTAGTELPDTDEAAAVSLETGHGERVEEGAPETKPAPDPKPGKGGKPRKAPETKPAHAAETKDED